MKNLQKLLSAFTLTLLMCGFSHAQEGPPPPPAPPTPPEMHAHSKQFKERALSRMKEQLNLTENQVQQIKQVEQSYGDRISALREQMHQLREQQKTEIESVLTQEQKAKLNEMKAKRKEQKMQRREKFRDRINN